MLRYLANHDPKAASARFTNFSKDLRDAILENFHAGSDPDGFPQKVLVALIRTKSNE